MPAESELKDAGSLTPEQATRLSTLMRQAQEGDNAAYEELLGETALILRDFLQSRVGREDQEDVVQETLISIHKARHTYDPGRSFAPWMYAIARYRLADFLRRCYRRSRWETTSEETLETLASPDKSDGLIMASDAKRVLAELPERQRQIIELLKIQGLSVKEVADRLGMSEAAVKVTAHRGYEFLRRRLGGRSHEDG